MKYRLRTHHGLCPSRTLYVRTQAPFSPSLLILDPASWLKLGAEWPGHPGHSSWARSAKYSPSLTTIHYYYLTLLLHHFTSVRYLFTPTLFSSTSLWPAVAGRRLDQRLLALRPGQEGLPALVPYCPGSGQAVLPDHLLDLTGKGYLQISCSISSPWPFWPKYKLATALLCRRIHSQCSFDLVAELKLTLLPLTPNSHPRK